MNHGDFKVGCEFKCGGKTFRCTDVGTRVVTAICISEVWRTQTFANTFQQEQVRVMNPDPSWLRGPPYSVTEHVFNESAIAECKSSDECEHCGATLTKQA